MVLSIITINFNNKDGLIKTIESVKSQNFSDFEWLVVDGGSNDGSKELIEKNKEYFSYWCSEPDSGIYNAMNKAIPLVKGEFMLFLNSGDELAECDVLQRVFSKVYSSDILYGDKYNIYDGEKNLIRYSALNFKSLLHRSPFCHQSMFIRSELMKHLMYDESYKISGDNKFVFECACLGKTFEYLGFPISNFDTSGISSSNFINVLVEDQRSHKELLYKYFDKEKAEQYNNEYYLWMFKNHDSRNAIIDADISSNPEIKDKLRILKSDYCSFLKALIYSLKYSSFSEVSSFIVKYPPVMWYYKLRVSLNIKNRLAFLQKKMK